MHGISAMLNLRHGACSNFEHHLRDLLNSWHKSFYPIIFLLKDVSNQASLLT